MPKTPKTHILNDAARQLRRAAKTLDMLASDLVADVAPRGSVEYKLRLAEANINAALARMAGVGASLTA